MDDRHQALLEIQVDGQGIFHTRPNRFLSIVDIINTKTGRTIVGSVKAHVHDPGRLKEILYPNNRVLLKRPKPANTAARKTKWDIIAGRINEQWILIHSGYHRAIAESIFNKPIVSPFGRINELKAEVSFGKSRLDFLITDEFDRNIYVEVKGCTLTEDGIALFPDAPTERGRRHLEELITAVENGYEGTVVVLVFREDSTCFAPNTKTDPKFADTFKAALDAGVKVFPIVLTYQNGIVRYEKTIPVCLDAR